MWVFVISAARMPIAPCGLRSADHITSFPSTNRQHQGFEPPMTCSFPSRPTESAAFLPRMVDSSSNPFLASNTSQLEQPRASQDLEGGVAITGLGLAAAASLQFILRASLFAAMLHRGPVLYEALSVLPAPISARKPPTNPPRLVFRTSQAKPLVTTTTHS